MSGPELASRLIQVAVLGPAVASGFWLLLAPWRWPRRIVAGLVALAAHAAAWWVFWLAYLGEGPAWRGLSPSLLTATVVALAEVGILVAALRAERPAPLAPAVVVGLGASTTALVLAGYTDSLILLALSVPIPSLAVLGASLVDRRAGRGLLGLAVADVLVLAGLSVLFDRTGTSVLAASPGLGTGLMLAGAAVKAGAVVGVGTARPSTLSAVLRGQGLLVAAIAATVVAGGQEMLPASILAAAAVAAAGLAAVAWGTKDAVAASVLAAGAAALFVALGLGGGFGLRAFLVLFPAFLLAAPVVEAAVWDPVPRRSAGRLHRLAGVAVVLGLGVALGSLAGVPPGGGFPGTWMTVSVGAARGVAAPAFYLLITALLTGLALALAGGMRLLRAVRPSLTAALVALPAALILLYSGLQPVRLGIGWWLRVEEGLALPTVLPSAGGPALPPVGGRNLALALAPGLLVAFLVAVAGRGVRLAPASTSGLAGVGPPPSEAVAATAPGPGPALRREAGKVRGVAGRITGFVRRPALWLGAVILLEVAAAALAVRLLVLAAGAGFL